MSPDHLSVDPGPLYSVEWTSGMPYFIPDMKKAYVHPDAAQAALKVTSGRFK